MAKRELRRACRLGGVVAICAALQGCGEPVEPLGRATNELFARPTAAWWPKGSADPAAPTLIRVCWSPKAAAGLDTDGVPTTTPLGVPAAYDPIPDPAEVRSWVRLAVENSWARYANIRFVGWEMCLSYVGDSTIVLHFSGKTNADGSLTDVPYRDRVDYFGLNPDTGKTNVYLHARKSTRLAHNHATIHEFGHALGFNHEEERPDNSANSACPVREYQTSGTTFTTWVDGRSVMCAKEPRNPELSAGDIIGVQQVYGAKPSGSLVGWGGRAPSLWGASWGYPITASSYTAGGLDFAGIVSMRVEGLRYRGTDLCLNVEGGINSATSGTTQRIVEWGCGDHDNERFYAKRMLWRAMGNMCVQRSANYSQVYLTSCDPLRTSRWDFFLPLSSSQPGELTGQIRLSGTNRCLTAPSSPYLGAPLSLTTCRSSSIGTQLFDFGRSRQIRYGAGYCANVFGGLPNVASGVGLWDGCDAGNINDKFYLTGNVTTLDGRCLRYTGSWTGAPTIPAESSWEGQEMEASPCVAAPALVSSKTEYNFTGLGIWFDYWLPHDPQNWDYYW